MNNNNLFANFELAKNELNSPNRKELFPSPPKKKTPPPRPRNSWESNYEYYEEPNFQFQNEYNNNGQLIFRNLPQQELSHVFTFVRMVYYEIYPMKVGENPRHWTNTIIDIYKQVRYEKAKRELKINKPKSQLTQEENMKIFLKTSTTLKGLQSHEIVGNILYCYLISENIPIPQSVLIIIMNRVLSKMKNSKVPFTLESFEKYKQMNELKTIITRLKPICYNKKNIAPHMYIRLMCNTYLHIEPKLIQCAENVCRRMQMLRKNGFKPDVSPDLRAIACVAAVCVLNNVNFNAKTFGLKEAQFNTNLKRVLVNPDEQIQTYLSCK